MKSTPDYVCDVKFSHCKIQRYNTCPRNGICSMMLEYVEYLDDQDENAVYHSISILNN